MKKMLVGLMGAFGAYLIWGLQPIYWKFLSGIDAWVVLAHRYCWSALFLIIFVFVTGQHKLLLQTLHQLKQKTSHIWLLILVSFIAVLNWWINVFAPISGQVVQLGIGLFLTPIFSIILGTIFYREKLNFLQKVSVSLGVIGVSIMLIRFGHFPWIALGVSSSWAIYGALKKKLNLSPSIAIFLETIIVVPVALIFLMSVQTPAFAQMILRGDIVAWALIGTGILTSAPLITYTYATNYLSLTVLGFCQYISPILTLCLGIFVYGEHFGLNELVPMFFVWGGIILFFVSQIHVRRTSKRYA